MRYTTDSHAVHDTVSALVLHGDTSWSVWWHGPSCSGTSGVCPLIIVTGQPELRYEKSIPWWHQYMHNQFASLWGRGNGISYQSSLSAGQLLWKLCWHDRSLSSPYRIQLQGHTPWQMVCIMFPSVTPVILIGFNWLAAAWSPWPCNTSDLRKWLLIQIQMSLTPNWTMHVHRSIHQSLLWLGKDKLWVICVEVIIQTIYDCRWYCLEVSYKSKRVEGHASTDPWGMPHSIVQGSESIYLLCWPLGIGRIWSWPINPVPYHIRTPRCSLRVT